MGCVFIADTHISRHYAKNNVLRQRLGQILTQHPMDWLCILGDICDDGEAGQYLEAQKLLEPWKNRILLTPGSHDRGPIGILLEPESSRLWADLCEYLQARDEAILAGWRIILVDSTRTEDFEATLAQGVCGPAELDRVRVAIGEAHRDGQKACVGTHCDPYNTDFGMQLIDSREFLEATFDAEIILHGHSHRHSLSTIPGRRGHVLGLRDFRAENLDIWKI